MRSRLSIVALALAVAGAAESADLRLDIHSAYQNERGGGALLDDRSVSTRSAMQVSPALRFRWENTKVALDMGVTPSMDVPGRGAGFLTILRSEARLSYFAHNRLMLQARVGGGRVSFDERSLWSGRTRAGLDLSARFAVRPSLHATGRYRIAHSAYGEPVLQGQQNGDVGRVDDRASVVGGLMWFTRQAWIYGELGSEKNRSTVLSYRYGGRSLDFGAGGEIGRVSLGIHGSRSDRNYQLTTGGTTTWRTLWLSAEVSYSVASWLSVRTGAQREIGSQDGAAAFDPWNYYHAGFTVSVPIVTHRPTLLASGKRLGPVHTDEGWVFRFLADDAESVHLVGTFSGWDTEAYKLRQISGTNIWEVIVPLDPGIYEYAYVVDGGRWVAPPRAAMYVDDGFGSRNGLLVVEDDDRR